MIDFLGATLGLILLAPFLPFLALVIKLDSRGPVLVKLNRVSGGKIVPVYKFRSMVTNAHWAKPVLLYCNERLDGPFFKMSNDPRVTRVGRFLRRTRLDEFPQLLNVLRGELSLVGPRPHEPEEVEQYPPPYQHLTLAKAGVTGLSQISGASSLSFFKELELDSYYLQHQSLLLDIKIIAATIYIVLTDANAV